MRRQHWILYFWLLAGSYCWQACLSLPQRSPSRSNRLVQPLNFAYLALSTTVSYRKVGQPQGRAYVTFRLQKDHCIWFSVLGPLGIEYLRGMVTPRGITLLNHMHKTYHVYDYATLQSLWPGPWDYGLVQAVLLGELAQAYSPQTIGQETSQQIVIQQQTGTWILNHLISPALGKVKKLIAKGPQGSLVATYEQFKSYQAGLLFREATFTWYNGTTPAMTMELAKLKPQWSETPLSFPFVIPADYEKR